MPLPAKRLMILKKSKSAGLNPMLEVIINTPLCGPLKKKRTKLVSTELTSTNKLIPFLERLVSTIEQMLLVPSTSSRFLPKTIALMSNHSLAKLTTLAFPLSPSAPLKSSIVTWKSHGTPLPPTDLPLPDTPLRFRTNMASTEKPLLARTLSTTNVSSL
jgi:hypothetical protein